MLNLIQAGGSYMWLLLVLAIVIIILAITKGIQLFSHKDKNRAQLENGINAILFWGAFSAVLGLFAHFHGIYYAMQAIQAANDISPAIVAGGYAVSIITILTGLFIFMIAAIIWFVFKSILVRQMS